VRRIVIVSAVTAALTVMTSTGIAFATQPRVVPTTNLTNCRFSQSQVFGGMSRMTATQLFASDFQLPFADHLHRTLTPGDITSSDYYAFTPLSGNNWALNLYKGNGTLKHVIDASGVFLAVGLGFYYYNGDGSFHTVIATRQGYLPGDANNWPIAYKNPTSTILNGMNNCSATTLAAGETLQTAQGGSTTTIHHSTTTLAPHATTTFAAPTTTTTSQLAHTGLKTDLALGSAMWLVAFGMMLMLATQMRRRRVN
jgi:hypothetical protein